MCEGMVNSNVLLSTLQQNFWCLFTFRLGGQHVHTIRNYSWVEFRTGYLSVIFEVQVSLEKLDAVYTFIKMEGSCFVLSIIYLIIQSVSSCLLDTHVKELLSLVTD